LLWMRLMGWGLRLRESRRLGLRESGRLGLEGSHRLLLLHLLHLLWLLLHLLLRLLLLLILLIHHDLGPSELLLSRVLLLLVCHLLWLVLLLVELLGLLLLVVALTFVLLERHPLHGLPHPDHMLTEWLTLSELFQALVGDISQVLFSEGRLQLLRR